MVKPRTARRIVRRTRKKYFLLLRWVEQMSPPSLNSPGKLAGGQVTAQAGKGRSVTDAPVRFALGDSLGCDHEQAGEVRSG
jgi:hypothetical protein